MSKLSIVCPYRGRPDFLSDFIKHFKSYYPESKIIVVEQCNSERFMRGQLLNIGFQNCDSGLCLFTDVDLRMTRFVDIVKTSDEFKCPFYPYDEIKHCNYNNGAYTNIHRDNWRNSPGGMYVYTKEQFLAVNGHSNLFFGHSYEDTDLRERANPKRLKNLIIHLQHKSNFNRSDFDKNTRIYQTRGIRDIKLDGVNQTTADIDKIEDFGGVKRIFVKKVGVCKDFVYMNLYSGNV